MPQFVFLDESHTTKKHGHPIYGVGGVVVDAERVTEVEERWRDAKSSLGIAKLDLHYSSSFPGGWQQRLELIEAIPTIPLRSAVVALLEDFRPKQMKAKKETRGDLYVHGGCFHYVLQRLCAPQYRPAGLGAHVVFFDDRDDFAEIDQRFRATHGEPWGDPWNWPSLRDVGYCESLGATRGGSLNEIADLVLGATTRWAACRCAEAKGAKEVQQRAELEQACRAVLHLFPTSGAIPKRWSGYSFVVWPKQVTGKEQLKTGLDRWLREVEKASPPQGDIPF